MARPVSGSRSRVGVLAVKQDAHNTILGALRDSGRENNVLLAHFRALQCVTLEATAITSITATVLAILNHQRRTRTSLTSMRKPKCHVVGALLLVCRWRL